MLLRSTASHVKLVSLAIDDTSDMSLSLILSHFKFVNPASGDISEMSLPDQDPNGLTRLIPQGGIYPIFFRRQDTVLSNLLIPQEA